MAGTARVEGDYSKKERDQKNEASFSQCKMVLQERNTNSFKNTYSGSREQEEKGVGVVVASALSSTFLPKALRDSSKPVPDPSAMEELPYL